MIWLLINCMHFLSTYHAPGTVLGALYQVVNKPVISSCPNLSSILVEGARCWIQQVSDMHACVLDDGKFSPEGKQGRWQGAWIVQPNEVMSAGIDLFPWNKRTFLICRLPGKRGSSHGVLGSAQHSRSPTAGWGPTLMLLSEWVLQEIKGERAVKALRSFIFSKTMLTNFYAFPCIPGCVVMGKINFSVPVCFSIMWQYI